MGYTTDFEGQVTVDPPLNGAEIAYLQAFAESRRMHRAQGPYRAQPGGNFGQDDREGVIEYNSPPPQQPALWCHWVPTEDGTAIEWDGTEKFYNAELWMAYLIRTFLMPSADVQGELASPVPGREYPPEFVSFTFDHSCTGVIRAQGEDPEDRWDLCVSANAVTVRRYPFTAGDAESVV